MESTLEELFTESYCLLDALSRLMFFPKLMYMIIYTATMPDIYGSVSSCILKTNNNIPFK